MLRSMAFEAPRRAASIAATFTPVRYGFGMAAAQVQVLEVPFVATVPAGHDVLVAQARGPSSPDASSAIVLDVTSSTLYCNDDLWAVFQSTFSPSDPVRALERAGWVIKQQYKGRVLGAVVSTTNKGESNYARTRLFVDVGPRAVVYR